VLRFLVWVILAALTPRALLVAENLCLRQQLGVLQRGNPQPRLRNADRWICASRWFARVARFASYCETRNSSDQTAIGSSNCYPRPTSSQFGTTFSPAAHVLRNDSPQSRGNLPPRRLVPATANVQAPQRPRTALG
jgi:hypothetical protein